MLRIQYINIHSSHSAWLGIEGERITGLLTKRKARD